MRSRPPVFAGTFYPDKPQELAAAVKGFVSEAEPLAMTAPPKAIIAPHAGYIYSGPVAGTAYASFLARGKDVERVVLLGPSHRVAFSGLAASGANSFETPIGPVTVDRESVALAIKEAHVHELEAAHAQEHSLEVHCPFIKHVFPAAHIVPLLAGDENWEAASQVLRLLWGDDATVVVVSSDLSHYHDYAAARRIDAATAQTVERLGAGQIEPEQACGATAINALLALASEKGCACTTLDLRNSGDTAGPRGRVVGYGAFAARSASS